MKFFLYRFLDNKGNIIYIGRTNDIRRRMLKEHFTNNTHLPDECYLETEKVEYTEIINESEEVAWTIVNKVDTIYKEKCRVQLLSAVPSTILLFHLVSSFRENYAVSWHYRILRCIRIQITGVPAENDMFYG